MHKDRALNQGLGRPCAGVTGPGKPEGDEHQRRQGENARCAPAHEQAQRRAGGRQQQERRGVALGQAQSRAPHGAVIERLQALPMGVRALQADGQQRRKCGCAQRHQSNPAARAKRRDEGGEEARAHAEDKPREQQEARHHQRRRERRKEDGRVFGGLSIGAARPANGKNHAAAHRMAIFRGHAPAQEVGSLRKSAGQGNDHARPRASGGLQLADEPVGIHQRGGGDLDGFVEEEFNALRRLFQEVAVLWRAVQQRRMGEGAGAGERAEQ